MRIFGVLALGLLVCADQDLDACCRAMRLRQVAVSAPVQVQAQSQSQSQTQSQTINRAVPEVVVPVPQPELRTFRRVQRFAIQEVEDEIRIPQPPIVTPQPDLIKKVKRQVQVPTGEFDLVESSEVQVRREIAVAALPVEVRVKHQRRRLFPILERPTSVQRQRQVQKTFGP